MQSNKVCIIAKYLYPLDTRMYQQVRTLGKKGISCDIICGYSEDQPREEHLDNGTVYRVAQICNTKGSFFSYLRNTFKFFAASFIKLASLTRKNRYGIIVVHTLPEFLVFVTLPNKLLGSKIILDGRDITVDLLDSRWSRKNIEAIKVIARIVEKLIVGFCTHIITASNGFRRSLIDRGVKAEKVSVMINTADVSIFRFDEKRTFNTIKENARFIYHGTISERFGILIALQAMKLIRQQIPGSVLDIYGWYDLEYRQRLEEFVRGEKLEDAVNFNGSLPLNEIYDIIKETDMGIVPYLSDNFMNIALSTKSFEYIASGLPIVASRLKSAEELFSDDCIQYARPGDPEDFAENIIVMCHTPKIREEKRDKAFTVFNELYTSDIQNRKYLQLISCHLGITDTEPSIPPRTSVIKQKDI